MEVAAPNCLKQIKIFPVGENSKKIYDLRQHALIGVSPFNSYFTEPNLIKLIDWALNNFKEISIFIPDRISIYTLLALGYSEEKAGYKTRRQDSYLKNKVFRVLEHFGFKEERANKTVVTFSELSNNIGYQEIYNDCLEKFNQDVNFKKNCLLTSSSMLASNSKTKILGEKELDIAVKYFLFEFPLFLNTPKILNQQYSLFVYHMVPEYLEKLYLNNVIVSPNQGYLKVNLSEEEVYA